jgi:hypothetical protein
MSDREVATMRKVLAGLLTECRRRDPVSAREAAASFAKHVDTMDMRFMVGRVFKDEAANEEQGLHPLAETAAVLTACADARRLGLGKIVAQSFLENAGSPRDLVVFREAYERISAGAHIRIHADWISQETLSRAAAMKDGLDEYLNLYPGVNRVSDLVHAALGKRTGGEQGWPAAAADPARRSLARAAFEDQRVAAFAPFSVTSLAEVMDWGMRARDLGIIDDDELWLFYQRYDAEQKASDIPQHKERRLREWLLDRGSTRLTDALREACVGLAVSCQKNT